MCKKCLYVLLLSGKIPLFEEMKIFIKVMIQANKTQETVLELMLCSYFSHHCASSHKTDLKLCGVTREYQP